ncbi:ketoacyl-ACP synthase III family protein [Rhizocola hellebori]|uniref:ketoacyl-ACP synthase III family protein n=1 Tax=Rhizocola hellebori TaxID=1392758 RepID=UPI00194576A1|nr:ketoacyl-ACP synthase III family protein [Rhizocola hellebori]
MRWDNLYVAGLGKYLPQRVMTTEQAVEQGLYDAKVCAANGYKSVRVAGDQETGPVMAGAAGRIAVERSGLANDDFGLVLHAYASHQGRDLWSPASFVQNETVGIGGPAFDVRGGCNGGLSALELAASYVAARPSAKAALITAGDAFQLPYVDRWTADERSICGDGGAAMVLSKQGGFARLLSSVSAGDPTLEIVDRGSGPWTAAPFEEGKPINLSERRRDYLLRDEFALRSVLERMAKTGDWVMQTALQEAGTDLKSVQFLVHTTYSEPVAQLGIYGRMGFDRTKTSFDWALSVGQVGAADELLGMTYLAESGRPKPGDLLVAAGSGAGYVWTVAVFEFLETPRW